MTEDGAVIWMAARGHTSYQTRIREIETIIDETVAEAGRYGQFCEFTQARVAQLRAAIEEVKREAFDRYDDWATD